MPAASPPRNRATSAPDEEDEEDYMSMLIPEPSISIIKETPIQRRARKKREAEARSRPKSKAERAEEEKAAREAALSRSLFEDDNGGAAKSKGLAMMAKMGFKPGKALGKEVAEDGGRERGARNTDGFGRRLEPIEVSLKEDRGGIGLDSEKKRKFRELAGEDVKRVKAEEGDYRERVRQEREDARHQGQLGAAMRVAERMADEKEQQQADGDREVNGEKRILQPKLLKSVNLLWRNLVKKREEKERNRRMKHDLHESLSRATYEDPDEDADDRHALGKDRLQEDIIGDLEEEDEELDEFNALEPAERLQKVVHYLRDEHNYCFWCKYAYPDMEMDGCPGVTEEDHD